MNARGADAAAILRQKMDFILVEAGAMLGINIGAGSRQGLRDVAKKLGSALPDEFKGLAGLLRWVEAGGQWPRITSSHPAYFYTLRSKPHADRDLVNMLLAELSPLDIRQLFICHKELFYRLYSSWPHQKKAYVANFLEREYQVDKAGARRALFGPEPGMEEPGTARPGWPIERGEGRDVVDLVGPWGAVRRGRE